MMKKASAENLKLEAAMELISEEESEENRKKLYDALLGSTLIVPKSSDVDEEALDRETTLEADAEVDLIVLQNEDGKPVLPVFTSEEALLEWSPEGSPYLAMKGQDLCGLAWDNAMASLEINPAGPVGGEITAYELESLAIGKHPLPSVQKETVAIDEETQIGIEPPEIPASRELIESVKAAFADYLEVVSAYLFDLLLPDSDPSPTLGVYFTDGVTAERRSQIISETAPSIMETLEDSMSLNFIAVDESWLESLNEMMEPIYQRPQPS